MTRILPLTIVCLFLLLLAAPGCSSGQQRKDKPRVGTRKHVSYSPPEGTRVVVRVIDGDTVVLNGGTRVRVNNINTPEIDEELGREAKDFAIKMVHKKMVRVEGNSKDHYGRVLGDLNVEGKRLSEELVRAGMAHAFFIPPVDKDRKLALLAAQTEAKDANRGIWATGRYQGDFHITSFHANPRGNDNFNLNGEYVRIASVAVVSRSLKGYQLCNKRRDCYTFGDVVVPAGYTVAVHSGHGTDKLDPTKQLRVFWNRKQGAWSNRGDTATLVDAEDKPVDQVLYVPGKKKNYK